MTEHDEQHIIAKQPTLLERLRLTDPEAAQAIERLKGERDNAIEQAAMECAVVEELDKTCKALRQQLADARQPSEAANIIERAAKVLAEAEARGDDTKAALAHRLAEARAREGQYREAWAAARKTLPPDPSLNAPWSQCIAFMDEALATPAPEPRIIPDGAHHSGLMKDYGGRYNPDFKAAPTSEAERPEDWYCGRCSEVVPLGERCRICGATKRESGVA